jgi:hypothetical protein
MFHTVRLQPGDSPKALVALGMKLKKKKKQHYILQPCPAFKENQCSIYLQRPERCRLFECRQLLRVAAGELTEAEALENIRDVQRRVAALEGLLERSGKTDVKRPLSKRYDKIVAEPVHAGSQTAEVSLREELATAMRELDGVLNRDFRLQPIGGGIVEVGDDEGAAGDDGGGG